jgi:hypothetical protein
MTPTTAAVMADSAALSERLPRSASMYGAPKKIHRKQGTNVTHTVTASPARLRAWAAARQDAGTPP